MFDQTVAIKEVRNESADVKTFVLDAHADFKPGQFISVQLDIENCDERCNRRPFSIASSPTEKNLMIAMKFYPEPSAFKKRMAALQDSDIIKIRGSMGNFVLDETKDAVMLSGGIGITPLRSMIKYATDKKLQLKITLLYSNKTPGEIVYYRDLEEMQKANKNLKVVHFVTRPEESKRPWNGETGRITADAIRKHAPDIKNTVFYICGPPAMAESLSAVLMEMDIDKENIKTEQFLGY